MLADKLRAASTVDVVFEIASYAAAKNDPGNIVIDKPSGTESGDLLVMVVCNGASSASDPASFSTPSGWTSRASDTDTPHLEVFTKVAGGSEPSSYTVVWGGSDPDGSSGIILRITKANYSTIGTIAQVGVGTAAVTATPVSTGAGVNTIFIAAGARGSAAGVNSYTSGWTEYYDSNDGTPELYNGLGIATKTAASGGSSGSCTVTFSNGNGNGQAVIIAVTEA